jgi:hypothetical protein
MAQADCKKIHRLASQKDSGLCPDPTQKSFLFAVDYPFGQVFA